ncbi:MAG TPA: glutamine--fructose-6-phosphate transaminase (isomerizing) [Acidimicrobiales bacterium]|jgi:glucosamine--fructose-6-phosphate aminotransferase (isomerizing)
MCGIIGVAGASSALPVIVDGLQRLEYRGYDSAGVVLQHAGELWRRRREGKLSELTGAVGDAPAASCGIGHTRWATHGRPSEANAHPHLDISGRIGMVHNGIIENFRELRSELEAGGVEFSSETDSEVLVQLVGQAVAGGADLTDALCEALKRVEGSFAVAVVDATDPDRIVASRRASPLIAGLADGEAFVASDIPALIDHTREIYVIDDDVVVDLRPGSMRCTDLDGNEVVPQRRQIDWSFEAAEKGGFDDFMLKEINEQPRAVADTLRGRLLGSEGLQLDEVRLSDDDLRSIDKVVIVGCGTSNHAAMVAKYSIEHWTRLPTQVEIASEFRYRDPVLDRNTLVVGVSQSGETLDTMEAIKYAKQWRARVLAVGNVVDSSMARDADAVLYTRAGPEIGVAATKTHVAQIVALELLALYLAQVRGFKHLDEVQALVEEMNRLPRCIEGVLERSDEIQAIARRFATSDGFFFIGRGVGYPVALEGALKLKEISYLRADAYPGGEMKHGPIALIEDGSVVVAIATRGKLLPKMVSNIAEVRARGATVILVANDDDDETAAQGDFVLRVPRTNQLLSPAVDVVALQLFAYAIAKERGLDVDQPRNLAKTVTVE